MTACKTAKLFAFFSDQLNVDKLLAFENVIRQHGCMVHVQTRLAYQIHGQGKGNVKRIVAGLVFDNFLVPMKNTNTHTHSYMYTIYMCICEIFTLLLI